MRPCGGRFRFAVLGAVVLSTSLAWAGPAFAQGAESGWTLEALVGVALDRNPDLAAEQTQITAAGEDVAAARGALRPRLDAVGLTEVFPRRERLLIFRHGFRPNDNPFENTILNYGLEVRLPLYASGRLERGVSLAEARADAAQSRFGQTRNALIFNVASAFYTGLRLRQVIAAQRAVLASLEESLRIAELQREVGRIAPLDLLRIRTRKSQAERDLAGARNAYAQTVEVLKELINVPTEVAIDVAGALTPAPTDVDLDLLQERAIQQRPDLIALRHEVRALREAVGIAAARLGPSVDLKASYRGVTGVDDGTTRDDAILGVELRIPLYAGGVLRSQKRKALVQLKEKELRLQAAERRARAELERAALDLATSAPRIAAAQRAVDQGRESLRVEREKFGQGRGTSNDLLLAEEALLVARTQLAAALADSQIARAALRFAVGEDPAGVSVESLPAGGNR